MTKRVVRLERSPSIRTRKVGVMEELYKMSDFISLKHIISTDSVPFSMIFFRYFGIIFKYRDNVGRPVLKISLSERRAWSVRGLVLGIFKREFIAD